MNSKPRCDFGNKCYRKNPEHRKAYSHDPIKQDKTPPKACSPGKRKREKGEVDTRKLKQTRLNFTRQAKPLDVRRETRPQNQRTPPKLDRPARDPKNESPFKKKQMSQEELDSLKNITDDIKIEEVEDDLADTSLGESSQPKAKANKQEELGQKKPMTKKRKPTPLKTVIEESSDEETEPMDCVVEDTNPTGGNGQGSRHSSPTPEDSEEEHEIPLGECTTPRQKIKRLFLVDMPEDFYAFFEFCENLNGRRPKDALANYGLKLVGPFDVLTGELSPGDVSPDKALCHWRYYMDPPELQTVVVGTDGTHYGYWRDEPSSRPFVVRNKVPACTIQAVAPNLFAAVRIYMEDFITKCNPFEKTKANKMLQSLKQWAEDRDIELAKINDLMRQRQKAVNSKTFNDLGIVVPHDKQTDVGYRPLGETNGNLKKMCLAVKNSKNPGHAKLELAGIEKLFTFANIANDEMDFGNGLELGIDLFCMGSHHFNSMVQHLLSTAYTLLNRPQWGKIIRAHLRHRTTSMEPSALT